MASPETGSGAAHRCSQSIAALMIYLMAACGFAIASYARVETQWPDRHPVLRAWLVIGAGAMWPVVAGALLADAAAEKLTMNRGGR